MSKWNFISNHGMALYLIHQENVVNARELAKKLDITERSVLRIIKNLREAGYLQIQKDGRSNHYQINHNAPLRREELGSKSVGDLLNALSRGEFS